MNKYDVHDQLVHARTMLVFDDFPWYTSWQMWTSTTTGGGSSVALSSTGVGGLLTLTTGAVQNNEAAVTSTNQPFTFQNGTNQVGTPMVFQCEINYTEASTNQAGIVVGVSSTWTHILADTTWVFPNSFSGAVVYKAPGTSTWGLATSIGTTQLTQVGGNSCIQAGQNQRIVIYAMINIAGQVEVTAMVGTPGTPGNSGTVSGTVVGQVISGMSWLYPNFTNIPVARATPIKQYVAFSGAAAMSAGVFLKSGAGGGVAESVNVDYIAVDYLARP
jgi:hypothetical protein